MSGNNGVGQIVRTVTKPCIACKLRHLRCDNQHTTCSRCKKSGIECNRRYSVRFKHTLNPSVAPKPSSGEAKREFTFCSNQTWVQTAKSFNFVDETQEVVNTHEAESLDPSDSENLPGRSGEVDVYSDSVAENGARPSISAPSYQKATSRAQSFSNPKRSSNEEHPKKRRAFSSVSPLGTATVPTPGEVAHMLAHSLMNTPLDGLGPSPTPTSPNDSEVIRQWLLLDSSYNLSSNFTLPFDESAASQTDDSILETHNDLHPWSQVCLEQPAWPLQDHQEAFLFTYFIREIAPMFDLCDHERHFAHVVPQRAPVCPPLLNAILAVAAKRLSRIGRVDHLLVDKYYQSCLRTLIPALSSAAAVVDENLLAAIVILRYMEEVDVPFSVTGPQSHLMGTRVIIAAQKQACDFSGLRLAAFWVALRQEIFMALIHSRPVHPNLLIKNIDPLLDSTDCDCSYANRIIVHCAACIQYCFGDQEQSYGAWTELDEYLDRWFNQRPWHFRPMSPEDQDESFLRKQTFLSDAVVTGMQHYYLAKLLLTAHDPKIPRVGLACKTALDLVNARVKELVCVICGIAEANPYTAPAFVNASISIAMAGDLFVKREEQEALHSILVKTDQQLAWPTNSAQVDLEEAWGWPKVSDPPAGMSIAELLNSGMGKQNV